MSEKVKNKVSRRRFIAAALAAVMAFSLFAIPLSASATEPNDITYYYVWDDETETWYPAPMGQDTVYDVEDNYDGTYTVTLTYGYYTSSTYGPLIGKVINFEGIDWDNYEFYIYPTTDAGGYVTFHWDPRTDPNYIELERLDIIFTYFDNPDWDNPLYHIALPAVAFCPFGGPPVY